MDSRIRFRFLILVDSVGACHRHGCRGWRERVDRIGNSRSRAGPAIGLAQEVFPLYMGWVLDTSGIRHASIDRLSDESSDESAFLRQAYANRTCHSVNANAAESRVFADSSLNEAGMMAKGRTFAVWSLMFWVAAVTAGRLLAYTYTVLTAD